MIYIKRMLLWLARQLFALYAPQICVIVFAVSYINFFREGPLWPIGIFAIFIVYIFVRYVKW
ncbi:hypothetical protein D5067_0020070 [Enterobacter huaxiensis]|nr:hypothetical protein D5067_0020070 [Enterobacter huaxiensis]